MCVVTCIPLTCEYMKCMWYRKNQNDSVFIHTDVQ